MKTADVSRRFGFAAIAAAFIFLFNPNLNIIDVLPDFIGYIIIWAALSRLSDMNEDILLARKKFSQMVAVDLAKVASIFIAFGAPNADERNSMLLLFAFSFAVLELIILIPAINALYGGLMNLGYRYENTAILGGTKRKERIKKERVSKASGTQKKIKKQKAKRVRRDRKNYTERIRSATLFFVIFKAAMYTLPEFTVLSTHAYDESSRVVYIYEYVGLLRSFALIATLVAGIVWLVRGAVYFLRVRRDAAFVSALDGEYRDNILPKESIFVRKTVKFVSMIFCAAALLCVDFRIENFNLIPDVLCAVLLIVAAISARKHIGKISKAAIPFVIYAVASLAATVIEYDFFSRFYYSAIYRSEEAYGAYCVMLASSIFEAAAFVLAVVGMTYMLRSIIKNYTGFSVPGASLNVDDKIKRVHRELEKKMIAFYVGAALCVASDIFYDFFAESISFAGFVNTICTLIFFATVYYVTDAIGEEVESKYMLE